MRLLLTAVALLAGLAAVAPTNVTLGPKKVRYFPSRQLSERACSTFNPRTHSHHTLPLRPPVPPSQRMHTHTRSLSYTL